MILLGNNPSIWIDAGDNMKVQGYLTFVQHLSTNMFLKKSQMLFYVDE